MLNLEGAPVPIDTPTGHRFTVLESHPLRLLYDQDFRALRLYLHRDNAPLLKLEVFGVDSGHAPNRLRRLRLKGTIKDADVKATGKFLRNIGFDPALAMDLLTAPHRILRLAEGKQNYVMAVVAESMLHCGFLSRPDGRVALAFFTINPDGVPFLVEEIAFFKGDVLGREVWGWKWSNNTVSEDWWSWNHLGSWLQQGEDKLGHVRGMLAHLGFSPTMVDAVAYMSWLSSRRALNSGNSPLNSTGNTTYPNRHLH